MAIGLASTSTLIVLQTIDYDNMAHEDIHMKSLLVKENLTIGN